MFVEKTIKDNKALVKVNGRIGVESSPLFRKELAEINYGGYFAWVMILFFNNY